MGRLDELDLFNRMLAVMETTAHLDVLVELLAILPPYDMQVSPAVDPY